MAIGNGMMVTQSGAVGSGAVDSGAEAAGNIGARVAVLQMTSGIDPLANAAMLARGVADAAAGGAAMLFAPEMSGLIDRNRSRATPHIVAEADSIFVAAAQRAAADAGIWVHLGSLPVLEHGAENHAGAGGATWRNRSIVIDGTGAIRARYDKLHLFDVDLPTGESWRESAAYAPGDAAVVVDTPVGALGLVICYDLRFAALFDALGAAGARVITVPAAFTVPTGDAHWHMILRTRAVDQGCFIIAPAQVGTHADGRATYGHSLVIDPWGRVLLDMGDAAEPDGAADGAARLGFADLDFAMQDDVRARLPVLQHRRALPDVVRM